MGEVSIRDQGDGTYSIDYINGEWATADGLTKKEAEHYCKNFDYDEIAEKFGWY